MTVRGASETALRALAETDDREIDLATAALALAALQAPPENLSPYHGHLGELVKVAREEVGRRPEDTAEARINILNAVIRDAFGYDGDSDTYDDLDNANLIRVIDRRRGLPVALGILYLRTAHHLGWDAVGLNFPGHFLIRIDAGPERLIVDPFNDGRILTAAELRDLLKLTAGMEAELAPDHYEPVDRRDVLMRLHNNVKQRHIAAGRLEAAVDALDAILLFAPDKPPLWRERGVIMARLGNLGAAIEGIEAYLDRATDDDMRRDAAALLVRLRKQLN